MSPVRTIALLMVIGMLVAACGGGAESTQSDTTLDDTEPTTTAAIDTTEASETTATTAPEDDTTTTAGEMDGVQAADSDFGEILVDPDGFTLYVFTADSEDESACYDSCAELWPPVPADTPIGSSLDAAMFGSFARDDGAEQLTVNGMPLYLYEPDSAPGEVNGQGFNDVWFVVDAEGQMVTSATGSSDDSTDDSVIDYGY